jgi:hypothetical protein
MNEEIQEPKGIADLEEYVTSHVPERFRYWILHQRGYADRFDWKGRNREVAKQEKERSIVQDWAAALFRENCPYALLESCAPPLPDCLLTDQSGRRTGVEVAELVDQATIERNKFTSYHWKIYSPHELKLAVRTLLTRKSQRLKDAGDAIKQSGFHKIVVILHCDEPDLRYRPEFCRDVLANNCFRSLGNIDEAFLLLPCPRKRNLSDFEAEFCRAIQIPIGT